jgi:hypothetical protein
MRIVLVSPQRGVFVLGWTAVLASSFPELMDKITYGSGVPENLSGFFSPRAEYIVTWSTPMAASEEC